MPSLPIPLLPSLRSEFPHLRPTPTVPVTASTARALDRIHRAPLPHPPFQIHPDLEAEAREACPAAIRALWDGPGGEVLGGGGPGGVCRGGPGAPREVWDGEGEGVEAEAEVWYATAPRLGGSGFTETSLATAFGVGDGGVVRERRRSGSTDTPLATAFRVEHVVGERTPRVSSSSSPAEEHQRIDSRIGRMDGITAQLLAQRRGMNASPTAAPAQPTSPRPPAAPPCLDTPSPSPGDRQSRHEGRVALGRALVLVRDRVDDESWREGVEYMRQNGGDVGALYEILSLGLQARTGVRDV